MSRIVTGDDTDVEVQLYAADGTTKPDLSTASLVQACLVPTGGGRALTPIYTCDLGHAAADLPTGKIVAPVAGDDTAALGGMTAKWEVQVIISDRKTTYLGGEVVEIVMGAIP
jgi:hypothetical protein